MGVGNLVLSLEYGVLRQENSALKNEPRPIIIIS